MSFLKEFKYHAPTTLTQAIRLLDMSPAPLLLGGGTFVLNHLKKSSRCPTDVIGLKKIPGLGGVKSNPKDLSIGAMTTIAELAHSEIAQKYFPSLSAACQRCATTPIRNMATIGGNIASRFFWVDLPVLLMALEASVVLRFFKGQKTIALEEFLKNKPSKKFILTGVKLPKKDSWAHYFRHTRSMDVDVPFLSLAFAAQIKNSQLTNVKLFVNSTLSLPVELKGLEAVVEGRRIDELETDGIKTALNKDCQKTNLDAYRIHCLRADCDELINFCKERDRWKSLERS